MRVIDLGRLAYQPAWDVQKQVAEEVIAGGEDTLIFVEHEPVLTLGANFHEPNLLLTVEEYEKRGIEVIKTDRGGDVTYHGPGQLVVYPIFDLTRHGKDLHKWMRNLEDVVILALNEFQIEGWRLPPHTGVWVGDGNSKPRKIAAIGVKVRKWVSLHGIAINVSNEMDAFELIVPCGIKNFGVTNLVQEKGEKVEIDYVTRCIENAFRQIFA